MMARTVFPDHAKVPDDGGSSLSSIPPERITDVRSALESSNGTPVAIPNSVVRQRPAASCNSVVRQRPAAAHSGNGVALASSARSSRQSERLTLDQTEISTKDELIRLGPTTVRNLLEAQSRYSRKRHREHAHKNTKGEENKIWKWAKMLDIGLGKQVDDPQSEGGTKWWYKGKQQIIDEIVAVVEKK